VSAHNSNLKAHQDLFGFQAEAPDVLRRVAGFDLQGITLTAEPSAGAAAVEMANACLI